MPLTAQKPLTRLAHASAVSRTPTKVGRTRFNPVTHGFKFHNTFKNNLVPALKIRTGGLCGGMIYSSLDFFYAGTRISQQNFRPANRTSLHGHIWNRQVKSLTSNLDKWGELGFNPGGARNNMKPNTQKPIAPPIIDEHELLGDQREVRLQFGAEEYRLSITRNQKLILTK